jgi:hypothetical protein
VGTGEQREALWIARGEADALRQLRHGVVDPPAPQVRFAELEAETRGDRVQLHRPFPVLDGAPRVAGQHLAERNPVDRIGDVAVQLERAPVHRARVLPLLHLAEPHRLQHHEDARGIDAVEENGEDDDRGPREAPARRGPGDTDRQRGHRHGRRRCRCRGSTCGDRRLVRDQEPGDATVAELPDRAIEDEVVDIDEGV